MPVRLVTPPTVEPVSLAEARSQLRLEATTDDGYVLNLITAARMYMEKICWRGFLLQTWELTIAGFRGTDRFEQIPAWQSPTYQVQGYPVSTLNWAVSDRSYRFTPYLELVRGHLADVPAVSIAYLDENGASQTLSPAKYFVVNTQNEEELGQVWLNEPVGASWPNTIARPDSVKVTYTVGWASPKVMPMPLKQALLLLVSQMYENRTPEVSNVVIGKVGYSLDALMEPYRLTRL